MNYRRIIWALALPALLLGGCVTSRNIAVEVTSPPEIVLPPGTTSLALVIRVPKGIGAMKDHQMNICRDAEEIPCRLAAGEKALLGYSEKIFEESDLEVTGVVEWIDSVDGKTGMMPPSLDSTDITRLCAGQEHPGILVSLETVMLRKELNFSSYKEWPHEARNKVWSKTRLYNVEPRWIRQAVMKVFVRNGWRIYDHKTKRTIFEGFLEDSVSYKVDGTSQEEVEKKLPSLKTSVERAGYVAGWDFAALILPSHRTVPRKYYGAGVGILKEATRNVKFRQWDRAEEAWKEVLDHLRKRKRAKILYNLALAREREGDYANALKYIAEAVRLFPSTEMTGYQNIIEREISTRKK